MTEDVDTLLKQQGIIRIDKEGAWFYNDLPIINRKIYLFFNQHITKDEEGGYSLKIGSETCRLAVEDTPYVVSDISLVTTESPPENFFKIKLNDETEQALDLATLYIGQDNVPYCTVKRGEFPARFLRAPYYRLAEHIEQEGEEDFYIFLNSKKVYVAFKKRG